MTTPRARPRPRPPSTLTVEALLRRAILRLAADPRARTLVRRYGMRLGASRFVAGETLDECVSVLRSLNERGLVANTTLLGETVAEAHEAAAVAAEYRSVLDRLSRERLRANVALKLTHLGLDVDEELARDNLSEVVEHAASLENFVRIDMEGSPTVDATLRTYRQLRDAGHDNVGVALQAYLYRSERDLDELLPLRPNVRLVKGAYLEPASVAFQQKQDVDANYARLLELSLRGPGYTAIATHDERLIEHAIHVTARDAIGRDRFEFQMLYGVRPQLQLDLVRRGYKVLVAAPFGPEWYPYLMRRLAERPANLLFFLRNLVRR